MPKIVLSTAGNYHSSKIDPGFANEVGLLVIVEDGAFQFVVVGGFVDGKSEFLIPVDG